MACASSAEGGDSRKPPQSGLQTPMGFANAIDYRVPSVAGDAKLVWDLSRHQHLPVLGRAYRASGDARYAAAGLEDIASWLDQCPFGSGMNWRSPSTTDTPPIRIGRVPWL